MRNPICVFILGFFLTSAFSGCVPLFLGAATGSGAVMLATGKLKKEVPVSTAEALAATKKSLSDMKLGIIREKEKDGTVKILSRYTDGELIHIDIHPVEGEEAKTVIEVRVGLITEEKPTQDIMTRILSYTKT